MYDCIYGVRECTKCNCKKFNYFLLYIFCVKKKNILIGTTEFIVDQNYTIYMILFFANFAY